jgi:hypothetical protein
MKFRFFYMLVIACISGIMFPNKPVHAATADTYVSSTPLYQQGHPIGYKVHHFYNVHTDGNNVTAYYGWILGPFTIPLDHSKYIPGPGGGWDEADISVYSTEPIWWNKINVYLGSTLVASDESHTYYGDKG